MQKHYMMVHIIITSTKIEQTIMSNQMVQTGNGAMGKAQIQMHQVMHKHNHQIMQDNKHNHNKVNNHNKHHQNTQNNNKHHNLNKHNNHNNTQPQHNHP